MAEINKTLFSEFAPISTKDWKDKMIVDLKGKPFDKKMIWRTIEGFDVSGYYRLENLEDIDTNTLPGQFPYKRGTEIINDWFISQDIDASDISKANAKAKDILNKGVNSLCFIASDFTEKSMTELLDGLFLEIVEVSFITDISNSVKTAELFEKYVVAKKLDVNKVIASVNYDPYISFLNQGKESDKNIKESIKKLIKVSKKLPKLRVLGVNAFNFNNAGSNITTELAFALSWGNEYLSQGTQGGVLASEIASKIKFNFGICSNYFMEIAKFRAARFLWAKLVEAWKEKGEDTEKVSNKMYMSARTSQWNMTIYDGHVNLLRSQTETMSAALGGVNSITVTPFDLSYETPNDFSERIARNQQLLLKEESHFDKVTDIPGGSYYIENLTKMIAKESWKIFLEIEEQGGFDASVKSGLIQKKVNEIGNKRRDRVSQRREQLLGTNQFPNFNETASEKIKKDINYPEANNVLDYSKGSSRFDKLRLATEKAEKRPKVFMLTIGQLNMRLARAQFASNFFGCAGYEIKDNLGFKTVQEGVDAARKEKADFIVVCSSDDEYAQYAPETKEAIGNGKEILVVAGAPKCMEELKAKGITNYVHVKCNVLDTLTEFSKQLNII